MHKTKMYGDNPAQAFSAFMEAALRTRPAQQFQTQVTLPEWQLEPDEEAYYGDPDQQFGNDTGAEAPQPGEADQPQPSDDAQPAPDDDQPEAPPPPRRQPQGNDDGRNPRIDQRWLDSVLRDQPRPPPR